MRPYGLWLCRTLIVPGFLVGATYLLPRTGLSPTGVESGAQVRLSRNLHSAEQRECARRVGPYATQDTAWQRLREARRQGYDVSGVFPCYDESGTRGYCFNVFIPC
jgi:hypothetical protein